MGGAYVKLWVPELKRVPTKYVHKPWEMPASVQESSGCVIGEDYPNPVQKAPYWNNYDTKKKTGKGGKKQPYRGYYEKNKGKGGRRNKEKENKKSNFELYG